MERLVGPQTLPSDDVFPARELLDAGSRQESDAPPLPADAFETEPNPATAAWLQPEGEQAALPEAEPEADGLDEAASEFDAESFGEEAAGAPYLQVEAAQTDEPFPVKVSLLETPREAESEAVEMDEAAEIREPMSPAGSAPDTDLFLDLPSQQRSQVRAQSDDEPESEADATSDLMDVLLRASGDITTAELDAEDPLSSGDLAGELAIEPPVVSDSPLTAADPKPFEARTEAPAFETGAAAPPSEEQLLAKLEPEPAPSAPAVIEAAREAAPAAPKPTRPVAKGFGLKPVRAWDPTKPAAPSSGRKGIAGRGSAGASGTGRDLGQLADGVSDRVGARSTDPRAEAAREGKRKPVLVCFLPVQGGNGASTVSLHVAEAISHHLNERVLLADFDFHSGTLAFRLGLKPAYTLGDVFEWKQEKDQTWENAVCPWKKLDVLVAPSSHNSIHPQSLEKLPEIFASAMRRYPYVIVDHPDAIYSSSRHIFKLADLVYLVCTPEITSLHLARRKVQQIRAMGVPGERLRLIVNRTGSWGSLGVQDVGKIVGVPVSWALNNDYAALRDAVWNGGLVQEGSALAQQLRELGWSIMGVDAPVAAEAAAPTEVGTPAG